ncbi:multicopper oxidase domain-containing protein [uncultured Microbacterium sp.]|uniref:multicopper oxidase domain-containing protein n=1 Tax=uncultured Microbacterium sp. TaxID=191216 RepID=UPI00261C9054|nr:multicopper oxidase domain-containing protein [uncultured Microbacterium sp.]
MTPNISAAPEPAPAPRNRGFWAMRDIPTLLWLILVVVVALAQGVLPMPGWLLIHLMLLGAVTHAILVWSQYFSFALLRSRATEADRRTQTWRLILSNGGAAVVITGVLTRVWPVTLVGAAALIAAVIWHGISLWHRAHTSMPGRFGHTIRYYIIAAAQLSIGAGLGAWLATGDGSANAVLAHAFLNVLGWIGLTIAGTVVTLWPTILRTRAHANSAQGAASALPLMALGVLVAAFGAIIGQLPIVALGLAGYLGGLIIIGVSLFRAATQKAPRSFAALSVGMGLVWWAGTVAALIVGALTAFLTGAGFDGLEGLFGKVVPFLAAGFAAQVLVGALSYLIPVVLGGGPTPVRAGTRGFDAAGPLRVAAANTALAVYALPVSGAVSTAAAVMYLIAMASFLVVMLTAMRAQRRSKAEGATLSLEQKRLTGGDPRDVADPEQDAAKPARRHGPITPEGEQPHGRRAGQAVAGLLAVLLVVAGASAADPAGMGWGPAPAASSAAPVKTVEVQAANMRFTPNRIEVPAGTRLIIKVTNTDKQLTHDLVLANGATSARLGPGASDTVDAGVITANTDGWCSVPGHRQMGMTMQIVVTGASAAPTPAPTASQDMGDMGSMPGMDEKPGPTFTPYKAAVDPLPASDGPVTRTLTLTVTDKKIEVAPGITQTLWVYNGTAPGPTLHGKVGDKFVITLENKATMGHSIDFHAGALAPDRPMRTIAPGESLTYTFTATRAGIWMYHCATMPMTSHMANGMFGAVIIEPDDLPAVDRSYVLVQNEYYLGDHDGGTVDADKIAAGKPDLVTFNGYANQYDHAPLQAAVGERVRVWVLDAGIERATSFHVIGGQFDTVWSEGAYLLNRAPDTGSQALGLDPGQGGFVELTFPEKGTYPFVSHFMIDAERGAHGLFDVQ